MKAESINRASGRVVFVLALIALSMIAIGVVIHLTGHGQPGSDEGTLAHIFQLSVVALFPTIFVFLATADWTVPWRTLRRLVTPAALLAVAFGTLYYVEHYVAGL